jgi:hypothetical protein
MQFGWLPRVENFVLRNTFDHHQRIQPRMKRGYERRSLPDLLTIEDMMIMPIIIYFVNLGRGVVSRDGINNYSMLVYFHLWCRWLKCYHILN